MTACTTSPGTETSDNVARRGGAPEPSYTPSPLQPVGRPPAGWFESACALPSRYLRRIERGYFPGRSPDVMMVPREPNFFGGFLSTSHSGPWDYVQRIPIVFYGPGFIRTRGRMSPRREITLADVAPTLARLIDLPWPRRRAGRAIPGVLAPKAARPENPRLILTVVWDGGGWNVLDVWPGAWPYLSRLMEKGATVANATVGSSPSVTPAVHTTLGTGTFPNRHGIVDIPLRVNGNIVGSFSPNSPQYLRRTTLADMHDLRVGNEAKVGVIAYRPWHLGMMGFGAYLPDADKDIATIVGLDETLITNERWYALPSYLPDLPGLASAVDRVDASDGRRDSRWMGHDVFDTPGERRDTPAWVLYQTKLITATLAREGFGDDAVTDLYFTNYKHPDEVGHNWNMLSPEMPETLRYTDDALRNLVRFLNREVGRREWVMVVTADHGQGPDPIASHAWPIRMSELRADLAEHFGMEPEELISENRPVGFWLDQSVLEREGITRGEIADFLIRYRLQENSPAGEDIPSIYSDRLDEPVIGAAFPSERLESVSRCAKR